MSVRLTLLLATVAFAGLAQAQDVGQHPAVFSPRSLPAPNPSTFIVAHPASLSWVRGHANHEHPAVTAFGSALKIDSNTFLVQPPAHADWVGVPAVTDTLPVAG